MAVRESQVRFNENIQVKLYSKKEKAANGRVFEKIPLSSNIVNCIHKQIKSEKESQVVEELKNVISYLLTIPIRSIMSAMLVKNKIIEEVMSRDEDQPCKNVKGISLCANFLQDNKIIK